MTTMVDTGALARESELAALRLQEAELQAQQDAVLAERLAIAYALGAELQGESLDGIGTLEIDWLDESALFKDQLAEVRAAADHALAEIEQETAAAQEDQARASRVAAEALELQERWLEKVAQHDAEFARKLSSIDEETWARNGDEIQEPLRVLQPLAVGVRSSSAPGGAREMTSQPTTRVGRATAPTGSRSTCTAVQAPSTAASADAAGASSSSAPQTRSVNPRTVTVECICCFDRFPLHALSCAGADSASSSTASPGCGHYFCGPCMTEYVRGAIRDRRYPVPCPMAGGRSPQSCRQNLSRDTVLASLEGRPTEQQAYELLEAESSLDKGSVVYCPHKSCSTPLLLPDNEYDMPPDQPTTCPACNMGFCPRCRIAGWHTGYTCSQFQQLPPHLRSAEDAAMLQLSARQQWKRCPQCKLMVERAEGCNHMLCRCGSNFCYACGKPYASTKPTAENVHGTPACGCPLFSVPEDEGGAAPAPGQDEEGAAPVPGQDAGGRRPFRGGRLVSRRRCRYAASINDCPQGVGRCWFWHNEDDEN